MENAGAFIGTAEHNKYVNDSVAELYDLVIDADNGKLYATSTGSLTPSLGTLTSGQGWVLPSDFNRLVSVHILDSEPFVAVPADPALWPELISNPPHKRNARYLLRREFGTGTRELYVFPAVTQTELLVQYVPTRPVLSLDADTFVGTDDELEYIEYTTAIKMLQKEESDTTALEYSRAQLKTRILNNVKDADLNSPRTIRLNRKRGINLRKGY